MSEELDFNKIVSIAADKDRETSLTVGVFKGAGSISVFQGPGAPKVKIALGNRMGRFIVPHFLRKLKENANPSYKAELTITKWEQESKTRSPLATITFARDDRNVPFIGISAPGFNPSKFYLRLPMDYDVGAMSLVEQSALAIDSLISVLMTDVPMAMALTSFKREFQGGGQRPGGGYGGGGGGYNRNQGGGGGQRPANNNAPANADAPLADEVLF